MRVLTLSTFPTFLTFLAQKLPFSAPASDTRQGPEIPPYPRRERLGPQTVGPEANDLTGRPESASKITMAPRRHLPDRRSHVLLDFKQGGIRYTAGVGSPCGATTSRRLGPKGDHDAGDMAVSAGKTPRGS